MAAESESHERSSSASRLSEAETEWQALGSKFGTHPSTELIGFISVQTIFKNLNKRLDFFEQSSYNHNVDKTKNLEVYYEQH